MRKQTIQILIIFLLAMTSSCKNSSVTPNPSPTPVATASPLESPSSSPSPTPTSSPVSPPKAYFTLGTNLGSSLDVVFAKQAIEIANKHIASGCLRDKVMLRYVSSLHNVEGPQVKTKEEAYQRFIAGAPYALDLRWYYKWGSSVIGYTYNWIDGMDLEKCYNKPTPTCPTETKIYSNTNIISGFTAGDYAAHITHELSHQARAGGFVHWTEFDGTFVYEIGYAMDDCVNAPTGRSLRNEQRLPSKFRVAMELHKGLEQSNRR